jgi:hypothetical protein
MHRSRRRRWGVRAAGVAVLGGLLAGCAQPRAAPGPGDSSGHRVDEVAAHRGQVCPRKLAQASDETYGFGTSEPADVSPSLPVPEAAWVCRYGADDVGPGPDGDGTTFGWVRRDPPRRVAESRLPALAEHVDELAPAEGDRACTADLGPRWMLVLAAGGDLTGVVVDDFGCQDVRLTDEPFRTPPGEATQPGTVSGVLSGPAGLLHQMRTVQRGTRSP